MKKTKLLRMLTIGVILSLLVSLLPASMALAARDIELDPEEGKIGDQIDVSGENWPGSDPTAEPPFYRYLDIYFSSEEADVGDDLDEEINTYQLVEDDVLVDSDGDFEAQFDVPDEMTTGSPDDDVRGGTYYILFTYENDDDIKQVVEFTVAAGEITDLDPDEGPVGTEVDISGEDFGDEEEITVEFDGDEVDIESGDDETDSHGDFDLTIIIPPATAGEHTITVMDETLSEVEETFTVEPEATFSPTQAPPGDTVEVIGTGFGDREDVDILLGTMSVANTATDSNGNFTVSFIVPELDEGTYELFIGDDDNNDVAYNFNVEIGTEVTITPLTSAASPGAVGDSVTVSGNGFNANSTITITYTSTPVTVATTTSDANGDFSAAFTVPASPAGAHTITADDGTNSLQVPFYMEGQAPPIPQPLLPLMGSKSSSTPTFDWEDVSDSSGVTYDLQITTSSDFTAASMVLDMVGLTESEYTLTSAEALESRSSEEPYYWRVRAQDGASNVGAWTGVGEFSVGFSFPDWTVHLWWGLGVIGAVFLGYFLGKRRAYYY